MNRKLIVVFLCIASSTTSILSMNEDSYISALDENKAKKVRFVEPDEKRPAPDTISYAQFRASPFTTITHVAFQVIRDASNTDYSATRRFLVHCWNIFKIAIHERVIW